MSLYFEVAFFCFFAVASLIEIFSSQGLSIGNLTGEEECVCLDSVDVDTHPQVFTTGAPGSL